MYYREHKVATVDGKADPRLSSSSLSTVSEMLILLVMQKAAPYLEEVTFVLCPITYTFTEIHERGSYMYTMCLRTYFLRSYEHVAIRVMTQ